MLEAKEDVDPPQLVLDAGADLSATREVLAVMREVRAGSLRSRGDGKRKHDLEVDVLCPQEGLVYVLESRKK